MFVYRIKAQNISQLNEIMTKQKRILITVKKGRDDKNSKNFSPLDKTTRELT